MNQITVSHDMLSGAAILPFPSTGRALAKPLVKKRAYLYFAIDAKPGVARPATFLLAEKFVDTHEWPRRGDMVFVGDDLPTFSVERSARAVSLSTHLLLTKKGVPTRSARQVLSVFKRLKAEGWKITGLNDFVQVHYPAKVREAIARRKQGSRAR